MRPSRNMTISIGLSIIVAGVNINAKEPEELVQEFCYAMQASFLCDNLSVRVGTREKIKKQVGGAFQKPGDPYAKECKAGLNKAFDDENKGLCEIAWEKYGCYGKNIPRMLQENPFVNKNGIFCKY